MDEAARTISLPVPSRGDEHGALGLGDELGALQDLLHRAAAADDPVVIELALALADQVLLFGLQTLAADGASGERQQLVDLERLSRGSPRCRA
jgi:hypothetical protein